MPVAAEPEVDDVVAPRAGRADARPTVAVEVLGGRTRGLALWSASAAPPGAVLARPDAGAWAASPDGVAGVAAGAAGSAWGAPAAPAAGAPPAGVAAGAEACVPPGTMGSTGVGDTAGSGDVATVVLPLSVVGACGAGAGGTFASAVPSAGSGGAGGGVAAPTAVAGAAAGRPGAAAAGAGAAGPGVTC
ncbi:MAG: hypothetical protein QOD81_619, partial [Solirubrobacteraceae bacterium]|nr:hypothetical protein [Solirubrobacteraceae bacterium]